MRYCWTCFDLIDRQSCASLMQCVFDKLFNCEERFDDVSSRCGSNSVRNEKILQNVFSMNSFVKPASRFLILRTHISQSAFYNLTMRGKRNRRFNVYSFLVRKQHVKFAEVNFWIAIL